jgi:hypothetical protein
MPSINIEPGKLKNYVSKQCIAYGREKSDSEKPYKSAPLPRAYPAQLLLFMNQNFLHYSLTEFDKTRIIVDVQKLTYIFFVVIR